MGTVDGSATDATGGAVVGARITLHNLRTEDRRIAVSNERGQFVFPSVPPGSYEVIAEASGFKKTVRANVVVEVQQTVRAGLALEIGSVAGTVDVRSEAPWLEQSSSSLGQVIEPADRGLAVERP